MSFEAWLIFAAFWMVFVVTPGPNAVNCINNGMTFGFQRGLWGVLAILTQATSFLFLSALGVTALIETSSTLFYIAKLAGAAFLIFLGVRGWIMADRVVVAPLSQSRTIYVRALAIATINAKSVAGYLAAFSQFVQPGISIWGQMAAIVPTALTITALSYTGYTGLGAWMGRVAYGAVMNKWFRRIMALFFILYGLFLGFATGPDMQRV